jgi:hypothetical protein
VDFDETFTPVIKLATIRTVLTTPCHGAGQPNVQLDVSNAFLHGHLEEHVMCQQLMGFDASSTPCTPTPFASSTNPFMVCAKLHTLGSTSSLPMSLS